MRMITALLLIAMIALASGSCAFLLRSSCENAVKFDITSPDGKYVATLFERNCGATADFSTVVNLRKASTKFNADDLAILVVRGQTQIDLAWDSNTTLRLAISR